jgi:diaminopimelate epimerase
MQYLRQKLHYPRTRCLLETKLRELLVTCEEDEVAVTMGQIDELGWNITLAFEDVRYTLHYLNTGVPHVVIFVEDLQAIDVNRVGRYFRFHEHFSPKGTNVNFVSLGLNQLPFSAHIRTYERGVERETLACGTGVTAAAYCLQRLYGFHSPISLQVQSGEWLQVAFVEVGSTLDNVTLKGPATWIADGQIELNVAAESFSLTFE